MAKIQALYIYPVKSCHGIAVDAAPVTPMGFVHDREWMIVDPHNRFLTQREEPRLALIVPSFSDDQLVLSAPGREPLRLPLDATGPAVEAIIWRDRCAAFDLGAGAATWLSELLGREVRLVRFDTRRKRPSSTAFTGKLKALNRFSDAFPWLLLSQASLDDLNQILSLPVPIDRFRPNIVIADVPAYAEDRIDEISTGEVRMRLVKPCTRCAITTVDQESGVRAGDEPLRTLRTYRFDRRLRGVVFGQNAILVSGAGKILRVGQPIAMAWKS